MIYIFRVGILEDIEEGVNQILAFFDAIFDLVMNFVDSVGLIFDSIGDFVWSRQTVNDYFLTSTTASHDFVTSIGSVIAFTMGIAVLRWMT